MHGCFSFASSPPIVPKSGPAARSRLSNEKWPRGREKVGTESLAVLANYQMSVAYRNASGQAELHQRRNDIVYVISGS